MLVFRSLGVTNITVRPSIAEKMRKIGVFQSGCYVSLDCQEQQGKILRKDSLAIIQEDVIVAKDDPLNLELAPS